MKRSETCYPVEARIKRRWHLALLDSAHTGDGVAIVCNGKVYTVTRDDVRPRKTPRYTTG